jgi:SAM-dependent methyltransferase
MPFCPLPATFLDDLTRAGDHGVLELGCAEGGFTRIMRERGASVVTLDRRRSAAAVVGDALAPPLRAGAFPVVVAANLLRHLWRRVDPEQGPRAWRDLVAPGGCLYILEDEPARTPRSVRNYRDLQAFLARLHDLQRGPLLPSDAFAAARRRWNWPGRWQDGSAPNTWPADAAVVSALLAGERLEAGSEADRLRRAIERDGLSYGSYWWSRWSGEAPRA